jgi:hypothetical protein
MHSGIDKEKTMRIAEAGRWTGAGLLAFAAVTGSVFGQTAPSLDPDAAQRAQRQERTQQIDADKTAFAASIVARWEQSARDAGRWDRNFSSDLLGALVKLDTENLLRASEASSYAGMMAVLATGRTEPVSDGGVPNVLGDVLDDLVYTPITPCRIVDTRFAVAGAIAGGTTRLFDVDGASFTPQGGNAAGCGIPFGVARAVTMTIVAINPSSAGHLTAWGLGGMPTSAVLNYKAGDILANTAIIPVVPGGGNDFSIFSLATSHVVVDVLGYYAAPEATPLDCTNSLSGFVAAAVNTWTAVDAACPAGYTVTGGGHFTNEGSLGYPGVWLLSIPAGNGWRTWVDNQTNGPRNIQTWARCCRVPGR